MLDLFGVADGTRTHDDRNHNPGLYQLSYSHRETKIIAGQGRPAEGLRRVCLDPSSLLLGCAAISPWLVQDQPAGSP